MGNSEPRSNIEYTDKDLEKAKRINAYLESKLQLFSNLKPHFDGIPGLKKILTSYMSLYAQSKDEDKTKLKHDSKDRLVEAGVYRNEELLEFLLLIAEQERSFEDRPDDVTDEELCKYYFDKYRSNEKWPQTDFNFYRQHTHSHQTEKTRILEEVAMEMITKSRVSLEKTVKPIPEEIAELIKEVDAYFQQAFSAYFGSPPPLSLIDVTHVTKEYTEHADRISGSTFIYIQHYYGNREQFIHYVIHEAMHLCFSGFNEKKVEEGLIEYFIEKMFEKLPPRGFSYSPVSETYREWKENFKILCRALPDAERYFIIFFLTRDICPLGNFLRSHLSADTKKEIEDNHPIAGISDFIASVMKIVN